VEAQNIKLKAELKKSKKQSPDGMEGDGMNFSANSENDKTMQNIIQLQK